MKEIPWPIGIKKREKRSRKEKKVHFSDFVWHEKSPGILEWPASYWTACFWPSSEKYGGRTILTDNPQNVTCLFCMGKLLPRGFTKEIPFGSLPVSPTNRKQFLDAWRKYLRSLEGTK